MVKPKFEDEIEEYLSLKSLHTREAYATGFRLFLEFYQAKYGKERNFGNFLDSIFEEFKKPIREQRHIADIEIKEFIEFMQKKKASSNSIRVYFSAIQNFLKFKQITVSQSFINVPAPVEQKINAKHEWSLEEIKQFVDKASSYREKALILCMFQSGLGVNEIIELNYGDVAEELEKNILPLCLKLVRKKTHVEFKTFFGRDAVHYLKLYLGTRTNLKFDDPLFTKERFRGGEKRITDSAIQQSFSEMAKDLDFLKLNGGFNPARPHSLRAAFNSCLIGKIDEKVREFWMGHSIGAESKAYLCMPTENLRALYLSAEEFLKIEKSSKDELSGSTGNKEESKKLAELTHKFEAKERIIDALVHDVTGKSLELEALRERMMKLENISKPALETLLRRLDELEKQVKNKDLKP
jgi:site-specific recombinase XerD